MTAWPWRPAHAGALSRRPWLVALLYAVSMSGVMLLPETAGTLDTAILVVSLVWNVIVGALVGRWWAPALPAAWAAAYLVVLRLIDLIGGGCSVCGEDEDWSNAPFYVLFLVVVPLTFTVLSGFAGARCLQAFRARRRGGAERRDQGSARPGVAWSGPMLSWLLALAGLYLLYRSG